MGEIKIICNNIGEVCHTAALAIDVDPDDLTIGVERAL